jgi:hypothetical protein
VSLAVTLLLGLVLVVGAPIALAVAAWLAYLLILVVGRMAALLPRLLTGATTYHKILQRMSRA